MNLVEFLEARISEQEANILGGNSSRDENLDASTRSEMAAPASLTEAMLAECAHKRAILADWKAAAQSEGITDPADAVGAISIARRSMLTILAAAYKDHPDYQEEWQARAEVGGAGNS